MLSVVYFMKRFRHYLLGRRFVTRTDQGALKSLLKTKDSEGQTARWIESLASFDFNIQHGPGKRHNNADALNRITNKKRETKENGSYKKTATVTRTVFTERSPSS